MQQRFDPIATVDEHAIPVVAISHPERAGAAA